MSELSRRSVLRGSAGPLAAGTLGRPFIADAAGKTATVYWLQGFVPEEDASFKNMVAEYEKTSGNKMEYSIVPFGPMVQKIIAAITSGDVPDLIQGAGFGTTVPLYDWNDKLDDLTDVMETQKAQYNPTV